MKYLKILGLAAVAAAAIMAFVGAGTAAAETTLCKETKDPCPAGSGYGVGQEIHAVSIATPETTTEDGSKHKAISGPTLTGGLGNITCESTVKGTISTATTPKGSGVVEWFNCVGGTAVTATNGTITIHHDAEHNGTVTLEEAVVKVTQAGIPCYYASTGVHGTLTGGNPAILHVTAQVPKIDNATHDSSAFCPANGQWHATYEVTTPKPLYVTTGA